MAKAESFASLRAMRDAHNVLLSDNRNREEDDTFLDAAEEFVRRGSETGRALEVSSERWAAQSMLDYWATVLFRRRELGVEAMLADFDLDVSANLDSEHRPYPGLEPFGAGDRQFFFGRDRLVREIFEVLREEQVAVLVGSHGSGRTSLLAAGILPLLKEAGERRGHTRKVLDRFEPGTDPLAGLARALGAADSEELARTIAGLRASQTFLAEQLDAVAPGGAVIVIDSLEQLYTRCEDADARAAFTDNLVRLVEIGGEHALLMTVASDSATDVSGLLVLHREREEREPTSSLVRLCDDHGVTLPSLDSSQLERAILAPAERVGLTFEEGLVNALVRDYLGEPLGLLQFALTRLWKSRVGRRVTWDVYLRLGRGREVLHRVAENVIDGWTDAQRELARLVLLEMVPSQRAATVRMSPAPSRSRLRSFGESEAIDNVLTDLSESQLVRRIETRLGKVRFELFNRVLIDSWPRLRSWMHDRELRRAKALAEQERKRADREGRLKVRAAVLAITAVVASILLGVTLFQLYQVSRLRALQTIAERSQPDVALAYSAVALAGDPSDSDLVGDLLRDAYRWSGTARFDHASDRLVRVLAAAVSMDGTRAASAGDDGTVVIWDLQSSEVIRRLPAEPPTQPVEILSVAFGRDNELLAGDENGNLLAWDLMSGEVVRRFGDHGDGGETTAHTDSIRALSVSPDRSKLLSGSEDYEVILWDLESGQELWSARDRRGVRALSFGPFGRTALSGTESGNLTLWDLTRGSEERLITFAGDNKVHTDDILGVAMSRDGCLGLSGSRDKTLILWDLSSAFSGNCEPMGPDGYFQVEAHGDVVRGVAFGPDGRFALSGSEDRSIALWDVSDGSLKELRRIFGHKGRIYTVGFVPATDHRAVGHSVFSGSEDGTLRVWDNYVGAEVSHLAREAALGAVGISDDGKTALAASTVDGAVIRWDIATGAEQRLFTIPTARAWFHPVFSSDLRWLITKGTTAGGVDIWDVERGALDVQLSGVAGDDVTSVAILRARGLAVSFAARVERTETPEPSGGESETTAHRGTVWNLETREPVAQLAADVPTTPGAEGHSDRVRALAIHPEIGIVASGSADKTAILWDATSGDMLQRLEGHTHRVTAVAFRPGHSAVATGSRDGGVVLWGLDGKRIRSFEKHRNEIRAIAFNSDGNLMLTASEDFSVILWHVDSGEAVHEFSGHEDRVLSVAMSAVGDVVVSGGSDGMLILWALLPVTLDDDLLEAVRRTRLVPELTPEQRQKFSLWSLMSPWSQ